MKRAIMLMVACVTLLACIVHAGCGNEKTPTHRETKPKSKLIQEEIVPESLLGLKVGETARLNGVDITVHSYQVLQTLDNVAGGTLSGEPRETVNAKEGHSWVAVDLTVKNTGSGPLEFIEGCSFIPLSGSQEEKTEFIVEDSAGYSHGTIQKDSDNSYVYLWKPGGRERATEPILFKMIDIAPGGAIRGELDFDIPTANLSRLTFTSQGGSDFSFVLTDTEQGAIKQASLWKSSDDVPMGDNAAIGEMISAKVTSAQRSGNKVNIGMLLSNISGRDINIRAYLTSEGIDSSETDRAYYYLQDEHGYVANFDSYNSDLPVSGLAPGIEKSANLVFRASANTS